MHQTWHLPDITQRRAGLAFLVVATFSAWASVVIGAINRDDGLFSFCIFALIITGLLMVYWRTTWRYIPHVIVSFYTLLLISNIPEPYVTAKLTLALLTPPLLALVLLDSWWIVGIGVTTIGGMIFRAGGHGPLGDDPVMALIALAALLMMVVGREVIGSAQRRADRQRVRAETALLDVQQAREHLEIVNSELTTTVTEQRYLLDLVTTLETPTITVADGVLVAPIIGYLDSRRAQALTKRLLETVYMQRMRLVVLDISGVSAVDTATAQALFATTQALRLLGCTVAISGIGAGVAQTLTLQGILLADVVTVRNPQEAISLYQHIV